MKRKGWKTTEFWLAAIATLIGLAYASGTISPEGASATEKAIAFIAAALASLGYSHSRGKVKSSGPHEN